MNRTNALIKRDNAIRSKTSDKWQDIATSYGELANFILDQIHDEVALEVKNQNG